MTVRTLKLLVLCALILVSGWTVWHFGFSEDQLRKAVFAGDVKTVKLLVFFGADSSWVNGVAPKSDRRTYLTMAILWARPRCVEALLIAGAHADRQSDGTVPLGLARISHQWHDKQAASCYNTCANNGL
jgi:hypothetical protein